MGRASRHSPEVRERAVRMVVELEREHDSQWAPIRLIAEKIGGAGGGTGHRPPSWLDDGREHGEKHATQDQDGRRSMRRRE